MTESSGPKQAKASKPGAFKKGQSGNPAGKPKGATNHTTRAAQALLDGQAEAITQAAINLALSHDLGAVRLCMERIVPPRKARAIVFDLPKIESPADVVGAFDALTRAVAAGELTPDEAAAFQTLLEGRLKAFEASEVVDRLARLEALLSEAKL